MSKVKLLLIALFINLLGLFGCGQAIAQTASAGFYLKTLPKEGGLLDQGWKFQPGDNPEWAVPQYNDAGWTSINPTIDIHTITPLKQA